MVTGWWNFGFRVWGFGTSFYEFHKGAFKRLVRAFGGFLSLRFLGLFQDFVNFSGFFRLHQRVPVSLLRFASVREFCQYLGKTL